MDILAHAWLIPALPLFSFVVVGLFLRPLNEKLAGIVATLSVATACALSLMVAKTYWGQTAPLVPWSFEWLRYQDGLTATLGILIDPLSVLLLVVVTSVSTLVHFYSLGYMKGESGFGRYFTYLNLFTFSMLGIVTAPNIIQMFVFWELVGVSSFLLIGFYYTKPSAVAASKKAFIVTRFADLGFLVGILLLGYFGYEFAQVLTRTGGMSGSPFDFAFLTRTDVIGHLNGMVSMGGFNLLTVALLLVFMGACGKSAMFPLHIWLPDAMEGPTPVSALIHAATMVVAGVYLVARLFPAYAASPQALSVVMTVGTFTCLFAAVIACTQDDIKRVLAFSTLSQLGYMMLALGVTDATNTLGYSASLFHLFTHAFFKALLFLGAGSIIHAVHSNSIWDMGGLFKKMPITHITFLIACLAIAGVPPFAGFFSKDEILHAALSSGHTLVYAVALGVAGLTAFYMFRIYFVSFWGKAKTEAAGHAHEAPAIMLLPLLILAILSCIAGFIPIGLFVHFGAEAHEGGINWSIAGPACGAGGAGILLAAFLYAGTNRAEAISKMLGGLYTLIKNKFYVDELYLFITHRIIFRGVAAPIAWFDRHVVDGGVNLSGRSTRGLGSILSRLQTGQVQTYAAWFVSGILAVLGFMYVIAK